MSVSGDRDRRISRRTLLPPTTLATFAVENGKAGAVEAPAPTTRSQL